MSLRPASHDFTLKFTARGSPGVVAVQIWLNSNPASVGCGAEAEGFPVCEASVSTGLAGYDSLFGWVQLVGTQSPSAPLRRFETDPLRIFSELNMPFGFYGVHPTLFDAPSRKDRQQTLDWLAHSFLCTSPSDPMERAVEPVAAFQWGFRMRSRPYDSSAGCHGDMRNLAAELNGL
jgi:hypothetical protein